jgi:hypothetical protein
MGITIRNSLNLGQIHREVDRVSPEALDAAAQHVLEVARGKAPLLIDVERANREEVPGTLRDSGYARVLDDVTAEVGFTDFIAPRMHEDMDLHHDDGQAKFLEEPMVTEKDRALQILADHVRQALGG